MKGSLKRLAQLGLSITAWRVRAFPFLASAPSGLHGVQRPHSALRTLAGGPQMVPNLTAVVVRDALPDPHVQNKTKQTRQPAPIP